MYLVRHSRLLRRLEDRLRADRLVVLVGVDPGTCFGATAPATLGHNVCVSNWGRETFGDPCRGCGFQWSMALPAANAIIDDAPRRLGALARRENGRMRHPDLQWSVSGYVCHVGDNIGIWAERVAKIGRASCRERV